MHSNFVSKLLCRVVRARLNGNFDPYPCENRGKRLKEFSFLNRDERFEEEYLAKNHGALLSFRESVAGTEAEKILRQYFCNETLTPLDSTTISKT